MLAGCQPREQERPLVSPALPDARPTGEAPSAPGLVWARPAEIDPLVVAKALDDSIKELEGARAEVELITFDAEGRGATRLNWLIDAPNRFLIEFVRTDRVFEKLKVVSDGERQAVFGGEGWRDFRDQPSGWLADSAPVLRDFRLFFPRQIGRPLIERQGFFMPLLRELRESRFEVVYETAEMNLNNSGRPFGRFLARHSRPGSSRIEIRFDGIRLVPVTIVVERGEGENESIVQWSAGWSFEQTFDPTVFVLPKEPNSP